MLLRQAACRPGVTLFVALSGTRVARSMPDRYCLQGPLASSGYASKRHAANTRRIALHYNLRGGNMLHNTLLVVSTVNDGEEPDENVRDRVAAILGKEYAVFLGTEEDAA